MSELGKFVRAHRERIDPASLGLPPGLRRRTPGLRREELALLCGVSVTWVTWLEQGRPVSASAKTIARLAEAMRLTAAERGYLFRLANKVDPEAKTAAPAVSVIDEVSQLLDAIAAPAYALDRQWNAVAWNARAAWLFEDWLGETGEAQRNLLRFMFLQPSARSFVDDWPDRARRLVAEFRAECGKAGEDAPLADLIALLQRESADFARWWRAQEVLAREGGMRGFLHPRQGRLVFRQVTLQLQGWPDLKVTVLLEDEHRDGSLVENIPG
ncbi:helix-turn-helix domain-containing protein [Noviherbaspirillum pedocola]|uniref:Helix-turn-helix domain-containing protein n=1 Tax=Noviherbaspirillum pedocola TaxID=2801341 RepID=A0A934SWY3_9BURK|nr:helix-turn-helix transcriptional regulator [Noviherbaspirillum pedocola]MBK4738346.1 helix-turn-helix domain-containing protein [Noviherbaspirillum pedocola]